MSPVDAEVAGIYPGGVIPIPREEPKFYMPLLTFEAQVFQDYYNIISNSVLWYLHHRIWTAPRTKEEEDDIIKAWEKGYIPVNQAYASLISDLLASDRQNIVMLQDYHLYLAAHYIRDNSRNIILTQFIHVPWPEAEYLSILPDYMRYPILDSLLANDIIGFHIPKYVDNFLDSCLELADEIDHQNNTIYYNGRVTHVKSYPISIDTRSLKELSGSSKVGEYEKLVKKVKGNNFLIYRTDRADLSKNILLGFEAYDLFLERYPQYQGKVKFLVTGISTRDDLEDYRNYRDSIKELIAEINDKYSYNYWKPIEEIFEAPYDLVVAALKNYDCLMVNPISDGMNIVSKEGSFLNNRNGVIILSKKAGSHFELEEQVISVDPFDVEETAEALHEAIVMEQDEKESKCNALKEIIAKNTLSDWISKQFNDIKVLSFD